MWHLSYRPEVEDDVVDAVTWYDDKLPGLGDEFLSEYLAPIQRIRDNPNAAKKYDIAVMPRPLTRGPSRFWLHT